MERFIKEYANYKKKMIHDNDLKLQEYKDKGIIAINKALELRERGMITVDEAIRTIMEN